MLQDYMEQTVNMCTFPIGNNWVIYVFQYICIYWEEGEGGMHLYVSQELGTGTDTFVFV